MHHFVLQSEVKQKPIVVMSHSFSRDLHQMYVITLSFDSFTALSVSFMIGYSVYFGFKWFYNIQLKTALIIYMLMIHACLKETPNPACKNDGGIIHLLHVLTQNCTSKFLSFFKSECGPQEVNYWFSCNCVNLSCNFYFLEKSWSIYMYTTKTCHTISSNHSRSNN